MRTTCLCFVVTLVTGCVGSIDSADVRKRVSELSLGELRALCDWMSAPPDGESVTPEQVCKLEAVQVAEHRDTCEAYRQECISKRGKAPSNSPGPACGSSVKTPPRGCTATVAELKRCFTDTQTELITAATAASCSESEIQRSRLPGSTLVACKNVTRECDSLLGETTRSIGANANSSGIAKDAGIKDGGTKDAGAKDSGTSRANDAGVAMLDGGDSDDPDFLDEPLPDPGLDNTPTPRLDAAIPPASRPDAAITTTPDAQTPRQPR